MATPPRASSGEQHQAAQSVLADTLAASLVRSAWPEFDPSRIKATLPRFSVLVAALIHRYGLASASQALSYYRRERAAAGVPGRPTLTPAAPPSVERVQKELSWATSDLYGTVTPEKVQVAQTKVEGVAEKLALDVGRETLLDAVRTDKQAKGWARVPEPGACAFCLMLATRGAVYHNEQTADFHPHDHCRCHVEPLFSSHYEPTAQVRAAQAIYKANPGLKNFRRAVSKARDDGHPLL